MTEKEIKRKMAGREWDLCKCGAPKWIKAEKCRKCFLEYYKTRTTKLCRRCNRELPLSAFRTRPDYTTSYGTRRPRSRCKECEAADQRDRTKHTPPEVKRKRKREYYHRNLIRVRKSKRRQIYRKMGLDPDLIEKYKQSNGGICEICGGKDDFQDISVDHCHEKGIFRGLLCSKCNMGLGMYNDNPELLRKAAEYLETHTH